LELAPLELAAREAQHDAAESDNPRRCLAIPLEPPRRTLLEVIQVPPARVAHMRPGNDLARDNRSGVRLDRVSRGTRRLGSLCLPAPWRGFSLGQRGTSPTSQATGAAPSAYRCGA